MKRTSTPVTPAEELAKNLVRHGIDVVLDKIDAGGKSIGKVLETYVRAHGVDMLVMEPTATPGMARVRLCGATKSMLSRPQLPTCFRIDRRSWPKTQNQTPAVRS